MDRSDRVRLTDVLVPRDHEVACAGHERPSGGELGSNPDLARPWRAVAIVAIVVCAAQALAIAALWLDGMVRIQATEQRLEAAYADIDALMAIAADADRRLDRQEAID